MEIDQDQPHINRKLIVLIIALFIYDDLIVSSLGMFQAFMPVPRIRFEELTAAFVFYLLVTRYKLIDNWLAAKIASLKSANNK
jgi:hypothetical protein